MKPEYCDDPQCPACDLKRHLQHIRDSGYPADELVEMTITMLADVVADDVHLVFGEMPGDPGAIH
jgi:hypothetical protein